MNASTGDLLKGRRIALIGGAGFIGHHLAVKLKSEGADVAIIDGLHVNNLLSFHCSNGTARNRELYRQFVDQRFALLRQAGIPLFVQDARDYHALSRLLTEVGAETVIHLAAIAHAGTSNKNPFSTFDHSLRTLENALDWSRGDARHFIYFSSSMAYGNFQSAMVEESHPLEPIGIYGALKVAGEKMVIAYQQVFDLPYTIVRPSALYGPRCVSRRVGQIFIENAFRREPLRIAGDGGERLDFTYVDDLTEGIARIVANPASRNEIFNLTYGESRSVRELSEIVLEEFPGVAIEYADRDRLMPLRGTLCVDKARDVLGYVPQFPIDDGMRLYIDWYRQFFEHDTELDDPATLAAAPA